MKDTTPIQSLTREDVTALILAARKSAGQTWEGIAAPSACRRSGPIRRRWG